MTTQKQTQKERFENALESAKNAFWSAFADQYEEVKTGDFPPEAHIAFENACYDAAKIWLHYNWPNTTHVVIPIEEFKEQHPNESDFYEESPICGRAISVRKLTPYNEEEFSVTLFITEYENGQFWTMFSNGDILGTLDECADFLIDNAAPRLILSNGNGNNELLQKCLTFLADLNGMSFLDGDNTGSKDMKQRAQALQSAAYEFLNC